MESEKLQQQLPTNCFKTNILKYKNIIIGIIIIIILSIIGYCLYNKYIKKNNIVIQSENYEENNTHKHENNIIEDDLEENNNSINME